MKATLLRQYPSKKNPGQTNYTYVLDGTLQEIAMYEQSQGDFLRHHTDGRPLFFTDKFGISLVKFSSEGKPFADTSAMDNANSLLNQLPEGALKNATAQKIAEALLAQSGFNKPVNASPAPETEKADDSEDLGQL
jgi:hypothetical protein